MFYGFYCLNCLHFFKTENKLISHKKVCKKKDILELKCHQKQIIILDFNRHMKSDKMSYIIYADIKSLITKIDGCANN